MRLVPAADLPRAMALVFTGVSVATVSAAPVGAFLGELWGWRTVFVLSAATGVIALASQLATMPRLPARGSPDIGTLVGLIRRPSFAVVLAGVVVVISGHFAGFTYIRPFLEQIPRLSVEAISLVLLAFGVGGFFGNLAGGGDRGAERQGLGDLRRPPRRRYDVQVCSSSAPRQRGPGSRSVSGGSRSERCPSGSRLGWCVSRLRTRRNPRAGSSSRPSQVAIASGAVFGGLLVDEFGTLGVIAYAAVATLFGGIGVLRLGSRSPERIEAGRAVSMH